MLEKANTRFYASYCYLFKDKKWYFAPTYKNKDWKLVVEGLKEEQGKDE